jgi:signal peptidase I
MFIFVQTIKMVIKKYSIKQKVFLLIVAILFFISICFNSYFIFNKNKENKIISEQIIQEGNVTYKNFLENYYNIEYSNEGKGLYFKINNPCIEIIESNGLSMKPYWDNNTLGIFDTCYPEENLEIGDIIIYQGELDSTIRPHHRIIDIDYKKRWIRTQGDNPETNKKPDDFVSFDRILGKEIGVLNVLEDKKIVKKEIINESLFEISNITIRFLEFNQTCVCSSSGFLKFCNSNKTIFEQDTFIQQNDLREEYCND